MGVVKPITIFRLTVLLAAVLVLLMPRRVERAALPVHVPEEPQVWAVEVGDGGVNGLGKTMPPAPFNQQRKPPCSSTQEALNGGCWYRLARKPPCGSEQYQNGDGCFLPVLAVKPPVSGQP